MYLGEELPNIKGTFRFNVNLSKTNWFGVGGNAEILFRPLNSSDLAFFIKNKSKDLPVTIIGVGSNILIRDGGIKGVVIKLGRGFTDISYNNQYLEVGSGCLNYNVANYCKNMGLSGLEFLIGIPGSIGGSLAMNAGCYSGDISSIIEFAEVVDCDGNILKLKRDDIGYIYRGNTLPENWIFTKAWFKTTLAEPSKINEKMIKITQLREKSQPIRTKTSGSTFKNPLNYKAWELIDEVGCRGLKIGDAMISEKHCNFIINLGNATANDIETLGNKVRKIVKEKKGIELEWEIKIIGEK